MVSIHLGIFVIWVLSVKIEEAEKDMLVLINNNLEDKTSNNEDKKSRNKSEFQGKKIGIKKDKDFDTISKAVKSSVIDAKKNSFIDEYDTLNDKNKMNINNKTDNLAEKNVENKAEKLKNNEKEEARQSNMTRDITKNDDLKCENKSNNYLKGINQRYKNRTKNDDLDNFDKDKNKELDLKAERNNKDEEKITKKPYSNFNSNLDGFDFEIDESNTLSSTNQNKKINNYNTQCGFQYIANPKIIQQKNCYIASYKNGKTPDEFLDYITSLSIDVIKRYTTHFNGIYFCTSPKNVRKINNHYLVDRVESDNIFKTASVQYNMPRHMEILRYYTNIIFNKHFFDNFLIRLLPLNFLINILLGGYKYEYTGDGVDIFMIDTTIDINEWDIYGRAKNLYNERVCNTHGTNLAMLAAGNKMGFAKNSRIYCLNVVDCDGNVRLSDILEVISYVHQKLNRKSILLFGISGPQSKILNGVVDEIAKNITVISPSGNNGQSACKYSPASAFSSITVGSLNNRARPSKFSNNGDCVNIFSIGENLYLRYYLIGGLEMQGSSVSAAIVTGAIAIYLEKYRNASRDDIWAFLARESHRGYSGNFIFTLPKLESGDDNTRKYGVENYYFLFKSNRAMLASFIFSVIIIFLILVIYVYMKKNQKKKRKKEKRKKKRRLNNEENKTFYL